MPLTPESWQRIVECGAQAPSGDNLQPWIVSRTGDVVRLCVDQTRDHSLYNFEHRASLIALGAMAENMIIAGREFGLKADVEVASNGDDELPSLQLTFRDATVPPDPLFPFTGRRCTNRKPYRSLPIAPDVLDGLRQAVPVDGAGEIRFIQSADEMRTLARAASLNDRLLFEIRRIHDSFFETIRWTARQAETTRDGLFIKTLELGPMAPGFRSMRSWPVVRVLNKFGASAFAPFHSFRTFRQSAALGFLQMRDSSREAFIKGGRWMERIWLTATSLGLSFQPMVGMLCLLPYRRLTAVPGLTDRHRLLLARAEDLFKRVLPLDDSKAAIMLFRIGYSSAPTATSLRRPIQSRLVLPQSER